MASHTSSSFTYYQEFCRDITAAFVGTSLYGLATGSSIHLIADSEFAPTSETALSEFEAVEATFTDYSAKSVTWSEPANIDGNVEGAIGSVSWLMSTDPTVTAETVYGYFITGGTGDGLIGHEMFDEGIPMAEPGDYLNLNAVLPVAHTISY